MSSAAAKAAEREKRRAENEAAAQAARAAALQLLRKRGEDPTVSDATRSENLRKSLGDNTFQQLRLRAEAERAKKAREEDEASRPRQTAAPAPATSSSSSSSSSTAAPAKLPSSTTATASTLPPDWTEIVDARTHSTYYWNRVTGATQWERPSAATSHSEALARLPPALRARLEQRGILPAASTPSDTSSTPEPTEAVGVTVAATAVAKERAAPAVSESSATLPPGWFSATDPASGKEYFFRSDGHVQWSRPAGNEPVAGAPPSASTTGTPTASASSPSSTSAPSSAPAPSQAASPAPSSAAWPTPSLPPASPLHAVHFPFHPSHPHPSPHPFHPHPSHPYPSHHPHPSHPAPSYPPRPSSFHSAPIPSGPLLREGVRMSREELEDPLGPRADDVLRRYHEQMERRGRGGRGGGGRGGGGRGGGGRGGGGGGGGRGGGLSSSFSSGDSRKRGRHEDEEDDAEAAAEGYSGFGEEARGKGGKQRGAGVEIDPLDPTGTGGKWSDGLEWSREEGMDGSGGSSGPRGYLSPGDVLRAKPPA